MKFKKHKDERSDCYGSHSIEQQCPDAPVGAGCFPGDGPDYLQRKTFLACALGNAACRKLKSVRYIRLPELLEELALAQAAGEFSKTLKVYRKYDLLILDEWLIRCLTPQESYNLLEVIEARSKKGSMIFCTQYEPGDWYVRIHPDSDERSAIAEAILDRIIHNSYEVLIAGKISMRERHGLRYQEANG